MRHGCSVVRGGIYELLFEVFQMKDHGFGLIRDRCNEKQKVLRDFEDNGFKRFSGVNWSVVRVRYWSVD